MTAKDIMALVYSKISDKSINASNGILKADYESFSLPEQHVPQRFRWTSGGDPSLWPNNGYDSGVNPQDSLETAII